MTAKEPPINVLGIRGLKPHFRIRLPRTLRKMIKIDTNQRIAIKAVDSELDLVIVDADLELDLKAFDDLIKLADFTIESSSAEDSAERAIASNYTTESLAKEIAPSSKDATRPDTTDASQVSCEPTQKTLSIDDLRSEIYKKLANGSSIELAAISPETRASLEQIKNAEANTMTKSSEVVIEATNEVTSDALVTASKTKASASATIEELKQIQAMITKFNEKYSSIEQRSSSTEIEPKNLSYSIKELKDTLLKIKSLSSLINSINYATSELERFEIASDPTKIMIGQDSLAQVLSDLEVLAVSGKALKA